MLSEVGFQKEYMNDVFIVRLHKHHINGEHRCASVQNINGRINIYMLYKIILTTAFLHRIIQDSVHR